MPMIETEDFFDYWCPKCNNYVLLEKDKGNKNMLEGKCALCGETFYINYEDWAIYDKNEFKKEDEEVE